MKTKKYNVSEKLKSLLPTLPKISERAKQIKILPYNNKNSQNKSMFIFHQPSDNAKDENMEKLWLENRHQR
jgi:hypothetical protein